MQRLQEESVQALSFSGCGSTYSDPRSELQARISVFSAKEVIIAKPAPVLGFGPLLVELVRKLQNEIVTACHFLQSDFVREKQYLQICYRSSCVS